MPIIQLSDAEIFYEAHGGGRPFVFFSETACDGEIWKRYQIPEFSKDHLVIIHDYRGTGKSSKPSIDYTTRMFCDDAAAVLEELRCATRSYSAILWVDGWRNFLPWNIPNESAN